MGNPEINVDTGQRWVGTVASETGIEENGRDPTLLQGSSRNPIASGTCGD
jgi:hypothetical protein